jgi:hypothetical protein
MSIVYRAILYLFMLTLLSACVHQRHAFPIKVDDCSLPCWQDIEIGTSEAELIQKIEENGWSSETASEEAKSFYRLSTAFEYDVDIRLTDGVVEIIILSFQTDDTFNRTISEVVSGFHTPSYFSISCCLLFYRQDFFKPYADIFIPSEGLVIRAYASYTRLSFGQYQVCVDSLAFTRGIALLKQGDILDVSNSYYSWLEPFLPPRQNYSHPIPFSGAEPACQIFTTTF